MSNPAFRRGGISPRGRGRGRGAGNSPRIRVDIDSSSGSSDLPELETRQSTESIHIMGDYYSDAEESYSESYDSNEHDWKSHQQSHRPAPPKATPTPPPPPDPNRMRRSIPQQSRRPLQRRPSQTKESPSPSPIKENQKEINSKKEEESSEYPYSDEYENDQIQNSPATHKINESNTQDTSQHQNNQQSDIPQNTVEREAVSSPQQAPLSPQQTPSYQQQTSSYQQQTPSDQQQAPSYQQQTPSDQQQVPLNQTQPSIRSSDSILGNEPTFQISYERAINLWKRPVQMTQNDVLVYRCQSIHDKRFGKVHIICSKNPVSQSSPYYSGMVVRHQNGSRFTILEKSEGLSTPRQLAGISFIDLPGDDSRIRYFRIAIPDENYRYMPETKEDDLSRIANIGNPKPNIKIWSSALPKKHGNGRLTLDMGPYQVKRSLKNFIIRDENDNIMFLIFKSFDGVCKIKAVPPFTPLIAFGLGVSILTSMK